MDTTQLLSDVLDIVNGASDRGECAHIALSHLTELDGYTESESYIVMMLESILDHLAAGQVGPELAQHAAHHTVAVAIALGYSIGAAATVDTFQSVESVTVPDDLSSLDFIEPVRGDN